MQPHTSYVPGRARADGQGSARATTAEKRAAESNPYVDERGEDERLPVMRKTARGAVVRNERHPVAAGDVPVAEHTAVVDADDLDEGAIAP